MATKATADVVTATAMKTRQVTGSQFSRRSRNELSNAASRRTGRDEQGEGQFRLERDSRAVR